MNSNNNSDMIDMQDKMGYVDTGPTPQPPNAPYQPVATSTSAHLIIKEPKPQRQLNIPIEPKKKLNGYNNKPEPVEPTVRTEKNAEKRVAYEPTEKSPRYANREEIKEMMVHKLRELADMLNSLNIDEPTTTAYGPRPTPSKSDPQQQIKRRPSKGKNPSPENNRHVYNKSLEYNEPIYTHRPYYTYYDHPPPQPRQHQQQQQEVIYNDDDYYQREEPYTTPYFQPQSSTYVPRPRRKSYSNLRDEEQQQHARLVRKTSRNNLTRHAHARTPQVTYDPRYDSYQPDMVPPPIRYHPSYYHPAYSPDDYY
ncbi:hypothetical protein BDF21DRAFT_405423 [Thamnidium elegans]|uniref:Uncharacterized protein n=1 Tax=Thamnidium elegans TaxID=101142 RepID=A0A8H7SP04_9FUNG|nr:hypothetical protein INT48_002902 [Thamnidium elegans]KAI8095217.1 hypothetical protein BDF21DRAFT_405423 [Thamnidium elegans]